MTILIFLLSLPLLLLAVGIIWFVGRFYANPPWRDMLGATTGQMQELVSHLPENLRQSMMEQYRIILRKTRIYRYGPALVGIFHLIILAAIAFAVVLADRNGWAAAGVLGATYFLELLLIALLFKFVRENVQRLHGAGAKLSDSLNPDNLNPDSLMPGSLLPEHSDEVSPDLIQEFVLYTRRECPLCDDLAAQIEPALLKAAGAGKIRYIKRDIDDGADWHELYNQRVPVLTFQGGVLLEGRPAPEEIDEVVQALEESVSQ